MARSGSTSNDQGDSANVVTEHSDDGLREEIPWPSNCSATRVDGMVTRLSAIATARTRAYGAGDSRAGASVRGPDCSVVLPSRTFPRRLADASLDGRKCPIVDP
jgi:hypothetical protein